VWAWLPEPKRGMFLQALARWLESVYRWQAAPDVSLLDAFQVLSSSLLQLLSDKEGTCVLLSNCIPSDGIIGIRMFQTPVVIVSWRDPADAYLSKKAAFPDNTLELHGWQNQLLTRIAKYLAGKKQVAGYARFWMDVSFEDFVQDDSLRQRLLTLLNLDDHPLQSTFDPAVSARNIGIHTVAGRNRVAWEALANKVNNAKNEAIAISRAAASDLKATPSAGFSHRSKSESSS
jgi:hypothetical protein